MARPEKQWLDYFSMDVEKDNKLKFLKAKFWTLGFWMYVELLQFIYKEGYFVYRDDDTVLLFMSETWLKEEEIELMLEFMLLKWLFNKDLYDKYKILTSNWIQKRYAEWSKKRKNTRVEERYRFVWEYDHIELMDTLTELKEKETELMDTESTQSKVKESKVKETEKILQARKKTSDILVTWWFDGFSIPLRRSDDLEQARKKLEKKKIWYDDYIQALKNYWTDITKRNQTQDYAKHRFKLLEFLTRKWWLVNFI